MSSRTTGPLFLFIQIFAPMNQPRTQLTLSAVDFPHISSAGKNAGIKEGTRQDFFRTHARRSVHPASYQQSEHAGSTLSCQRWPRQGSMQWACIRASDVGACHRRDLTRDYKDAGPNVNFEKVAKKSKAWSCSHRLSSNWREYVSEPVLCRGDDGLSNRVDRLKALGNAVVPQVAAIPLSRVKEHNRCT